MKFYKLGLQSHNPLFQLRIFGLGLLQDGDIGVGVLLFDIAREELPEGSNPARLQKFSIIQALLSVVQAAMARYRPSGEGLPQVSALPFCCHKRSVRHFRCGRLELLGGY